MPPIFEYQCPICNKEQEVLQRHDATPPKCFACGVELERKISKTTFNLKGSGWFSPGSPKN